MNTTELDRHNAFVAHVIDLCKRARLPKRYYFDSIARQEAEKLGLKLDTRGMWVPNIKTLTKKKKPHD